MVNQYLLMEKLGTGSYGKVKLCKNIHTGKQYLFLSLFSVFSFSFARTLLMLPFSSFLVFFLFPFERRMIVHCDSFQLTERDTR